MTVDTSDTQQNTTVSIERRFVDEQLQSALAVDRIIEELRARRYEFTIEEAETLSLVEGFDVKNAEDYKRGYELLDDVAVIVKNVEEHYSQYKGPLNKIVTAVRGFEKEDVTAATQFKPNLSAGLVAWKKADDARRAREAAEEQKRRDEAAAAEHAARVAAMAQVAQQADRPEVQAVLQQQVESMKTVTPKGAPVAVAASPRVSGYIKQTWSAKIVDVKTLLRAWLDGKCYIDETCIVAGTLQKFLDKQADALQANFASAYPGCEVVCVEDARRTGRRS